MQSSGKMEKISQKLMDYYQEGNRFDAILASDDELAIGALKFAKSAGLKVPEDLSIIGCNNSVLSVCCSPELSSIDNKCELLCVNTVASLMRVLDGGEAVKRTVLSTQYVDRDTVKKL